ncbi:MAG: hypothetical protein HYX72_10410 [Acidobacteria bacterium]|nr:hypothetical protein [Acidobacteriota bacterium]
MEVAGEVVIPVAIGDEGVLCQVDFPPLLPISEAEVLCEDVRRVVFGGFGERLVFDFRMMLPEQYAGTKLQMFVRYSRKRARPPLSSKLFKTIAAACGSGSSPRATEPEVARLRRQGQTVEGRDSAGGARWERGGGATDDFTVGLALGRAGATQPKR